MSDISIVIRPIEVILSFIIFSSLIMINVILTKKLILSPKVSGVRGGGCIGGGVGNSSGFGVGGGGGGAGGVSCSASRSGGRFGGFGAKLFIIFVYLLKFFIYAGAIFLVDKMIGITFSFILGVLLALGVFLVVSLILYTRSL